MSSAFERKVFDLERMILGPKTIRSVWFSQLRFDADPIRPTILAPLEMVKTEIGQFTSSETATEQDGNDRSVALSLTRPRIPHTNLTNCKSPSNMDRPFFYRRRE